MNQIIQDCIAFTQYIYNLPLSNCIKKSRQKYHKNSGDAAPLFLRTTRKCREYIFNYSLLYKLPTLTCLYQ